MNYIPSFIDYLEEDRERIRKLYALEKAVRNAVSRGDRNELIKILQANRTEIGGLNRIPLNPIRNEKNLNITINTLLRLSAEKGGLPLLHLHKLSENFALAIERTNDMNDLLNLRLKMVFTYCDAVANYSANRFSAKIRKAANYINTHLDQKISLPDIADHVRCNSSYLSRQFRKETGRTVSAFIREKRIDAACSLLKKDDLSISNIASRVGFEDANYFSRVFSRQTGTTPSEYRKGSLANPDDGIPDQVYNTIG